MFRLSDCAIRVKNLRKQYSGRDGPVDAVNGLDLEVVAGECFGLLGPNGAGKTTTIQLLLGLTTPTSGDIRVLGMSMPAQRLAILSRVNFSSAYISLPSNLTVRENLRVFAGLYGVAKPRARIDALLELFEVFVEGLLPINAFEEASGSRCMYREHDHAIVAVGGPERSRSGRGAAKAKQRMWSLGDRVKVRAERIDPMRHRVEFALL